MTSQLLRKPKKIRIHKITLKEAENSFEAEVIDDDADIQVVPPYGEDFIEYTMKAKDVIRFLTIFVALAYYYNNTDNALFTEDILEEQEE